MKLVFVYFVNVVITFKSNNFVCENSQLKKIQIFVYKKFIYYHFYLGMINRKFQ